MNKKQTLLVLMVAVCIVSPLGFVYGQDYAEVSTSVRLYSDGSASVDIVIEPDPTLARLNVSLMGNIYEDFLVVDSDGIFLSWTEMDDGVEVDGLGVEQISLSYSTSTLTNKTGSMWTAKLVSEVNAIITLPKDAVLVGLVPAPLGITFIEENPVVTMPAGISTLSYLLGTTGTQEQALVMLNQAEDVISGIAQEGITVTQAVVFLSEAQTAYDGGQFSISEQLSRQAKDLAVSIQVLSTQAMETIGRAEDEIASKNGDLSDAQMLLNSAEAAYDAGNYQKAIDDAQEAYVLAQGVGGGFPFTFVILITVVLAVGGGYVMMNRGNSVEHMDRPDSVQPEVDLDMEFRERPYLRTDDKAILRYIQESGGAFITEVRNQFDIPKSSAWRMVKRLEEEGLVTTSKVGRETYLQLSGEEQEQ